MIRKQAEALATVLSKHYGRPYHAARWGTGGKGRSDHKTWRVMTHYEFERLPRLEQERSTKEAA